MTQVPPVAVAPVPTSVSSYWSPLGVVVIAMGPRAYHSLHRQLLRVSLAGAAWRRRPALAFEGAQLRVELGLLRLVARQVNLGRAADVVDDLADVAGSQRFGRCATTNQLARER